MYSKLAEELPFFNLLQEDEKKQVINNMADTKFEAHQAVYGAGDQCPGVIYVKKGELRAYMLSEDGKEVTLYRLKDGDVCALSASCMLKSITFDIFIEATKETEAYLVSAMVLREISKVNLRIENYILNNVAEKFSEAMWTMNQILFMSMEKRLAIFLYDEYVETNSLTIKLTHEEIAKYIGSAREVVSRMLKTFKEKGIIKMERNEIIILDKKALSDMAN